MSIVTLPDRSLKPKNLPPSSRLLNLPPELLLQVLSWLDPPSFSIVLHVCKSIRDHASSSRTLLLHQINKVPGSTKTLNPQESTIRLLSRFHRRATRHLQHGIEVNTDLKFWTTQEHTINQRQSTLHLCPCLQNDHLWIAEIDQKEPRVRVYSSKSGCAPQLLKVLSPHTMMSMYTSPHEKPEIFFKVLMVAFTPSPNPEKCCDKVSVLYSYELQPTLINCFIEQAIFDAQFRFKLTTYDLGQYPVMPDGPNVYSIEGRGRYPTALITPNMFTAIITWKDADNSNQISTVEYHLHKRLKADGSKLNPMIPTTADGIDLACEERINEEHVAFLAMSEEGEDPPYPFTAVSSMKQFDNSINIYHPKSPVPFWRIPEAVIQYGWRVESIDHLPSECELRESNGEFTGKNVGLPIASHHEHRIFQHEHDPKTFDCMNKMLHLAVRVTKRSSCTITRPYLVTALEVVEDCSKIYLGWNLDHLEHRIVAELHGMDFDALSTLGIISTVAHSGRRIAMTSWNRVFIWAVNPRAFIDGRKSFGDNHEILKTETEYRANQSTWGHSYYENCLEDGVVVLNAVELPSAGVVYSLEFQSDNVLWAWTDRGLVQWKFDRFCSARRQTEVLGQCRHTDMSGPKPAGSVTCTTQELTDEFKQMKRSSLEDVEMGRLELEPNKTEHCDGEFELWFEAMEMENCESAES
ncbi:hypothetical protein M501DRAFT_989499 [Patellaria atrata CBS 101060]|uniref:F-box domain-containing protein n=1 Tax=Patellaria atrata CBS 101060 TaxID=1346257 RepID=A0A9P4S1N9_9PEZI|nr:hypothetical protein M501DRAFT_989499 [Patellaria atrata CBS 101060]